LHQKISNYGLILKDLISLSFNYYKELFLNLENFESFGFSDVSKNLTFI
jgi:hypothetical protein